jgi:DNA-3-methyladenine glycosylase I
MAVLKTTYCKAIANMKPADGLVNKHYHDNHYGFAIDDDDELFCRLILEINQAGLSWSTILHKQQNFRKAYHNFNIKKVASYTQKDIDRLLQDVGIIRNKLKINAAVFNAKKIILLQAQEGSFKNWLDKNHPLDKEEWTKLFKQTFVFTGGEIVNEFLMSTGYLPNAHDADCPVYKKILKLQPKWSEQKMSK